GLFQLGVRSLGASDRRVADLAGVDLRTIHSDRAAPSLGCVGRVGALLGLPTASACAIIATAEACGGRLARTGLASARTTGLLHALAAAEANDDLVRLESLRDGLIGWGGARDISAAHDPRPADLGLGLCISARVAAARGEVERVEPLLRMAARIGVPRAASALARRLVLQSRADLALGAPWLAHAAVLRADPSTASTVETVRTAPRLLPLRWLRPSAGAAILRCPSTNCPHRRQASSEALLALVRRAHAMLERESSPPTGARSGVAARLAPRRAAWSLATAGMIGVRVLEWATAARDARVTEAATTLVVRAQLALESMLVSARCGLRELVLARSSRLLLAEWALRQRLGETSLDDLEAGDRAELAGLLHRFPAARSAFARGAGKAGQSTVCLEIFS
ncbi:MAG: hypothetical protein RI967_2237, partial [Planctomycetota bacterium]